jgi:hypothetical protein
MEPGFWDMSPRQNGADWAAFFEIYVMASAKWRSLLYTKDQVIRYIVLSNYRRMMTNRRLPQPESESDALYELVKLNLIEWPNINRQVDTPPLKLKLQQPIN